MSPEDQVKRAQRAALILNDDTFKAGIQALRDRALESFRAAPANDLEALRAARVEYDVTERLINEFARFIADGKLSALRIAERDKAKATQN